MADIREVFTTLESSDGTGIPYEGKAPGAAQSTDVQAPVLPMVDSSGNLQNITTVAAGDTATAVEGQPGFVAIDDSGNFTYLNVDSAGKLCTTSAAPGTVFNDLGDSNPGNVGTAVSMSAVALSNSKDYLIELGSVSATKPVKWELILTDNAVDSLYETIITGPGEYTGKFNVGLKFTTGATGGQTIKIKGTQLRGPVTDLYSSLQVLELP